jgi:hypothetical protein
LKKGRERKRRSALLRLVVSLVGSSLAGSVPSLNRTRHLNNIQQGDVPEFGGFQVRSGVQGEK